MRLIGRHDDAANPNNNGMFMLQVSCNSALCIMHTSNTDLHKDTWCRNSLGQYSLLDFCIVSANLFQSVLNVRVNREAKQITS